MARILNIPQDELPTEKQLVLAIDILQEALKQYASKLDDKGVENITLEAINGADSPIRKIMESAQIESIMGKERMDQLRAEVQSARDRTIQYARKKANEDLRDMGDLISKLQILKHHLNQ